MNAVLARYGATNPRRFGSVARGDSSEARDIDLMVDLNPSARNAVMHGAAVSRGAYFHVDFSLILDILETPPTDSGV
jgi:predicted nucleotidyltransferase